MPSGPVRVAAGVRPHDGDTFPIAGGNARLYGADAFEIGQTGRNGAPADLGAAGQSFLQGRLAGGGIATPTGSASYGRPVMSLTTGGQDAGNGLISAGLGLPTPNFLAAQPQRLNDYVTAQRDAIANERGAYAGQYQSPTDFRRLGQAAPWQGKTPMSSAQANDYRALVTDPFTAPATVADWARRQGQPMENAVGLTQLSQRTPTAAVSPNFQQRDVTGAPVQPAGPNIATRTLGAFNEGLIPDVLGAPVDLINSGLRAVGLPMSDRPIGGSASISDLMHRAGIGQVSDVYAARSTPERYLQSVARGVGQAALPVGGALSAGARLAASAAPIALRAGNPIAGAFSNIASEAFAAPAATIAGELGGGVGAGIGGQAMRDTFPGNPYADAAGQLLGGGLGGFAGAMAPRRGFTPEATDFPMGSTVDNSPLAPSPAPLDDAAFRAQAQSMFDGGASADNLRSFAQQAGGYSLNGLDEAVRYRDAGGKGARFADAQRPEQAADAWAEFADAAQPNAMAADNGISAPSISARVPDRIDVWDQFPDAESFQWEDPVRGFSHGAGEAASPDQMAAIARGAQPEDFQRLPASIADAQVPEDAALPAVPYEDLDGTTGGFAGNIRLDKLETPQDISRALAATDLRAGGFEAARRGIVSQDETRQLARELGMTSNDLLRRQRGQALNAEQALAARAILAKSGNELTSLAQRAVGGSDLDKVAFRESLLRHMAIQEQVSGATAEAGRALAQFRMTANSRDVSGKVLKNLIDQAGGPDRLNEIAQGILELRDPGQQAKFLRDAAKPNWSDKLLELRYNFMLSGPQTHAVNMLSNTMTAIGQLPEHAVAAGIGAARQAVGLGSTDRVLGTEVGSRAVGLINGLQEGLRQFARTLRTGEESDFFSKVEANRAEAIPGRLGFALRTPTRMLSAEDELFKAMARRMELAGLATRKAYQEGLKGDAAKTRAGELLENPTDEMLKQAFDYGRYVTFQAPLGEFGQAISKATNASPIAKLFVPFVRTPTNILKFAVERSPAAPLLREWRNDVAAGGARRDLALARTMIGSAVGAMAMQWAADGLITGGGPADESAERLMRADGWQPYSLKVGDRYYSYQRLDPFSTTLGIAADMADLQSHMTDKQREEVASLLTASVMQSLSNKTWLSGLNDLAEAFKDPGRYGQGLAAGIVTSITVPAFVSQTTRTVDPFLRDARSIMDRVKARIPVASRSLPMRRDVWGQPIISEGGVGPDMATPIWTSTARNDPTNRALLDAGMRIGMPSRSVGGAQLTPQQYSDYQAAIGRLLKPRIDAVVQGQQWRGLPQDDRKDLIDRVVRDTRRTIRRGMMFNGAR